MKSNITGHTSVIINAPKEKVWQALTDPEIIHQYFFGTHAHTDWTPGSSVTFTGEWEGKTYEDKGTVLTNEKNHVLRYTYWGSMSGIEDKPENYAIITYLLRGTEEGVTSLEVTQENIPSEQMRKHSEENWSKVLNELKALLEKDRVAYGTFFV